MRSDWTDLPEQLRAEIEARTGPITGIDPAPTGNHADIASTLHTPGGRIFVKAARKLPDKDGPEVMSLRREATVNPHVGEFAPRLLWTTEDGGWLALAFEHVDGRHADFTPGSPDLEILAKTVQALQATPCPDVVRMLVERRWQSVADDVSPMAGDALLHTDLNDNNLLITPDGRAYVVDWAFTGRGAAWVELGLLIPWLLKAGHSTAEAEHWVAQFPAWSTAAPAHIDLFSRAFAEKWRQHAERDAADWVTLHASLTRGWAEHRRCG
ncbi:phosphotransferase [Actinomadura viridis]|uniref:phosphotransferase n=1 Tax=Actinomadura viridis TaxID=58110 RepID=UPI0036BC932E